MALADSVNLLAQYIVLRRMEKGKSTLAEVAQALLQVLHSQTYSLRSLAFEQPSSLGMIQLWTSQNRPTSAATRRISTLWLPKKSLTTSRAKSSRSSTGSLVARRLEATLC